MPVGIAAVLAPLAISAVAALVGAPGTPTADDALIELAIRDVGSHPVLVGLFSRPPWSHPGPLVYYILALPYHLFGSSTPAVLVGTILVNGSAITGMTLIARRLGGVRAALLTLLAMSLLVRSLGAEVIRNPWVCYITVIPFGCFLFCVWAMIELRRWALPVATLVASFLIQTHVGFAPLTLPLLLGGTLWMGVSARRSDANAEFGRVVRAGFLALLVAAVVWAPPLWDQLFGSGNLGKLTRWFARADEGVHTVAEGGRVVSAQFAAVPDWITGHRRAGVPNGETLWRTRAVWPVWIIPVAGAAVLAWRRRAGTLGRLLIVSLAAVAVGVVAVARTIGVMYEYRLLWTWTIGAVVFVVIGWALWNELVARWPSSERRVLIPTMLVTLAVLSVLEAADIPGAQPAMANSPAVEGVARQLSTKFGRDSGAVEFSSESVGGGWQLEGLVLALEKRGVDARVKGGQSELFGAHRVRRPEAPRAQLLILAGHDLDGFQGRDHYSVIAYAGPVSLHRASEIGARRSARRQALWDRFAAGEMSGAELARAIENLPPEPDIGVAILRRVRK